MLDSRDCLAWAELRKRDNRTGYTMIKQDSDSHHCTSR